MQIYKSVTIRGAGPDQTVLQALGPEWVALNIATDGLEVVVEGLKVTGGRRGVQIGTGPEGTVTLRNVKVEGNGDGKVSSAGLWILDQATVTVDQTVISGNQSAGLTAYQLPRVTIQNSTISQNKGSGVLAYYDSTVTIENATITENGVVGLGVYDQSRATIEGSTVSKNTVKGLELWGEVVITLKKSTISQSQRGIHMGGKAQATIQESTISENRYSGILMSDQTQATIQESTIKGTFKLGVETHNGSKVTIENSVIEQNSTAGIGAYEQSRATISKSTISRNVQRGIWAQGKATIVLDNNTISQNRRYGAIWAEGQADLTITNNTISGHHNPSGEYNRVIFLLNSVKATITGIIMRDNDDWGVMVGNQAQATILDNTISNNGAGVLVGFNVSNETPSAEISRNNIVNNGYCGVYVETGPGPKITGQGNTISNNAGGNLCGDLSKFPAGFGGGK